MCSKMHACIHNAAKAMRQVLLKMYDALYRRRMYDAGYCLHRRDCFGVYREATRARNSETQRMCSLTIECVLLL